MNEPVISIELERPDDIEAIRRLTIEAFRSSEFGYNGEADLIDQLRENCDGALSLVVRKNHELIGHIFFSPVSLIGDDVNVFGVGLAPMSVRPDHQKRGVGSVLVRQGVELAFERGNQFVVVLGHPEYYPKFGFKKASTVSMFHGFEGVPQEVFFLKHRAGATLNSTAEKRVLFHTAFGKQFE